ncbi:NRDE-2, necessary for RNA interference-domain-containing protein [Suillus clintonianus]|uniref:NRDE-2, necessary for RNA interference-domain-containing protein n=1 Tax=Suillus clintonianus TaxID=1904413 RepID=UPI001B886F4D|nr:NRDE-2, necessary for RNA interference-domain-containing protein [Suillus clintonianus]KAG2154714.1 NRDE-2, necessary for RNA interference-domain-containing protein [Suillus clintonianus]
MSTPSFSSFPPSFASFPDLDPGPSRHTLDRTRNESSTDAREPREQDRKDKNRRGSKKLKDESRKDKKHKTAKHHLEPVLPRQHKHTRKGVSIPDDEKIKAEEDRRLAQSDIQGSQWDSRPVFFSDRKGDQLNVTYGSNHAGNVPKYHLVNRGRSILGLDGDWAIYRRGKGIEIIIGRRHKQPALTDSSVTTLLAAPPSQRLIGSGDSYKYEEVDGFLRLPSGHKAAEDYRSITKQQDHLDSDSQSSASNDSSGDESGTPILTSHQLSLKALEQQLAADPSSVETWLSLVRHSLSNIPLTSKNAAKARAEITLSILTRARAANPHNKSSRILFLKYLRAGEEVWHESKTKAEWEEALKLGGIEIWIEWLEWRIRTAAGGVETSVTDATRVFNALGSSESSEIDKLRVLWRVAVAFQQAGYHERTTALFQAQAELTFEVPQSLYGLPHESQLESLEEFWESEVPRAGEPGAKGWGDWMSCGRPDNPVSPLKAVPQMDVDDQLKDPYVQWHHDELCADRTSRVPARSVDTRSESDPYATVLLSDIKALLLPIRTEGAKNAFRLIWLSILGLHIPGLSETLSQGSWDDRWSFTYLSSFSRLESIFPAAAGQRQLIADSHAGTLIGREREFSNAFGPIKEWSRNALGPLEWVGEEKWRMWVAADLQEIDKEFVRAVFSQLRCGSEDYEWDIYALAFEAALNIKSALKLSRTFLSTARDSLPHWAAHARLERLREHVDDARKVYQTVLVTSQHTPTQPFVGQLWWDWAEMEWLSGDENAALRVIQRSVKIEGTGGMMVLRVKRSLDDTISCTHEHWKDREAWIKLRALVELLSSSSQDAALAVLDSQPAASVNEKPGRRESIMVASLMLLYNYSVMLRRPTPTAVLRDRLQIAVDTYPDNSLVLGMFLEAEKGHGIWGRVRAQLGQSTADGGPREKSISRRIAEVWVAGWEKVRWQSEIERTRSGLAAAAESERTTGSAILWRVILEFEIRVGELQRGKKLLYRAVNECPLAKDLYMLAFGPLRSVFSARELDGFVDIMAERGIRMRKGVDEYVERMKGGDESGSDNEDLDGSEDEIEHEARQRRLLMPY